MGSSPAMPRELKVLGILYLLGGIVSGFEFLHALLQGRALVHLGVLGIFIGPGLLRLNDQWRTCALVLTWILFFALPIISIMLLATTSKPTLILFWISIGETTKGVAFGVIALTFILTLWQYRVLTREDVRRLFLTEAA
jgi:hypothetical protein